MELQWLYESCRHVRGPSNETAFEIGGAGSSTTLIVRFCAETAVLALLAQS